MTMRIEMDSMGEILVSNDRLWGAQTQRALKYFKISNERLPIALITALAQIKRIAAQVNCDLGLLDKKRARVIMQAADEVLSGIYYQNEFPVSLWQTGSGTQTNMNMNEVLANRANELLGITRDQRNKFIHPNDHVNKSQSSNDVFPSAIDRKSVV